MQKEKSKQIGKREIGIRNREENKKIEKRRRKPKRNMIKKRQEYINLPRSPNPRSHWCGSKRETTRNEEKTDGPRCPQSMTYTHLIQFFNLNFAPCDR